MSGICVSVSHAARKAMSSRRCCESVGALTARRQVVVRRKVRRRRVRPSG
jgi:hypothetical protein